jgi:hypothetical protein
MANKLNSGISTFTLSERVSDYERVQEVLASIRLCSFFDAAIEREQAEIALHLVALNLVMKELSDKYGVQPFDIFKVMQARFEAFDQNDSTLFYFFEGHFIEGFRCIAEGLKNILGLDNGVLEQFRVNRALKQIDKFGGVA